jgi:hypothetical protein
MIKYLELALSQEVYEYLDELDQMNWSARGNVLNQYLSNTSIGTTVIQVDRLQSISRNFDHKCSELRCEVRKFVAKFGSSYWNSQANL